MKKNVLIKEFHKEVKELRKDCLKISYKGQDGNLQSVFSCIDIMYVLYKCIMSFNDRFVLSKGQASLGLYSILAKKGLINKDELNTFCTFGSRFGMQIDKTKFTKEKLMSTGSLGHGLPFAVGISSAKKNRNIPGITYCLCGDGELMEGTMWESIMYASHYQLDNLTVIVDNNHSAKNMIDINDISNKFESFGFKVVKCSGHNLIDLIESLFYFKENKPVVVICDTVRGYGSVTLENDKSWFHRAPKDINELNNLLEEVENFYEEYII
ncbi:MAG: thiamine pyrophosphate-dependent enzyme [Syntrophothermus sp.]